MNRREFLIAGGTAAAGALTGLGLTLPVFAQPSLRVKGLRTITYNVFAFKGYPDFRRNREALARARTQMPALMADALAEYSPDIVTFQESPAEGVVAEVAGRLKMNYAYFPGGWPGAVITKFTITDAKNRPSVKAPEFEELFSRHFGRALLDTGEEELVLYSVHLHARDVDIRAREVTEVLRVIEPDLAAGRSLLLQGDFNHTPERPEYARWAKAGLSDTFALKGEGPPKTTPSITPFLRLDYIWAHGPITSRLKSCKVLYEKGFRTYRDNPESFALSDHVPVMATFG